MIEEIRITGLGVIADATLELGPGLTVISGETGAGKTMVLQGLHLLLGGRADAGVIRAGDAKAVVQGTLVLQPDSAIAAIADGLDALTEDDRLILTRSVSSEGRSRAVIGGRAAPIAALAEIAESAVAVHGQNDQIGLLKPGRQRALLDRFGVDGSLLEAHRSAFLAWRELVTKVVQMQSAEGASAVRIEALASTLAKIEAATPIHPGEIDAIEAELSRLDNAEALDGAARSALSAVAGDDALGNDADALTLLGSAIRSLRQQADLDPVLAQLAEELAKAQVIAMDVGAELSRFVDSLDADPARLEKLQSRKAILVALVREHGTTLDDVLSFARDAAQELSLLSDESALPRLLEECERARTACGLSADALHRARKAAAQRLADAAGDELRGLGMPDARLEVEVSTKPDDDGVEVDTLVVAVNAHGADEVELLLAAHPGASPRPLAKGASGGELSRVMLALEVALAGSDPMPTMVFDEVDAGVGGKAAIEVGARLSRLGRDHQVICVTHLAQVAAFADHHIVVRKSVEGSVTASDVAHVDGEQRIVELSRMLSGVEGSDLAQGHAQELLELAEAHRRSVP